MENEWTREVERLKKENAKLQRQIELSNIAAITLGVWFIITVLFILV